jgi:hypothetical protein
MNAKRDDFDDFDDFDDAIAVAIRGSTWNAAGGNHSELWPVEEQEHTAFVFALRDDARQGQGGLAMAADEEVAERMRSREDTLQRPVPLSRAPRSSSPELPTAAMPGMNRPAAPWPAPRGTFEPATVASLEDTGGREVGLEIEIEVGTYDSYYDEEAVGNEEEGLSDVEELALGSEVGTRLDDESDDSDDSADVLVGRTTEEILAVTAAEAENGSVEHRGEDATDEDAAWWMSIDAGLLAEGSVDEEMDLPPPPGVIAGVAGTSSELELRLLQALQAPLETQCSCGHDCDQREHALRSLFRELSISESKSLRRRLALARRDDTIARAFTALPSEHRTRLLGFLDEHAGREAHDGPNWSVIRKI